MSAVGLAFATTADDQAGAVVASLEKKVKALDASLKSASTSASTSKRSLKDLTIQSGSSVAGFARLGGEAKSVARSVGDWPAAFTTAAGGVMAIAGAVTGAIAGIVALVASKDDLNARLDGAARRSDALRESLERLATGYGAIRDATDEYVKALARQRGDTELVAEIEESQAERARQSRRDQIREAELIARNTLANAEQQIELQSQLTGELMRAEGAARGAAADRVRWQRRAAEQQIEIERSRVRETTQLLRGLAEERSRLDEAETLGAGPEIIYGIGTDEDRERAEAEAKRLADEARRLAMRSAAERERILQLEVRAQLEALDGIERARAEHEAEIARISRSGAREREQAALSEIARIRLARAEAADEERQIIESAQAEAAVIAREEAERRQIEILQLQAEMVRARTEEEQRALELQMIRIQAVDGESEAVLRLREQVVALRHAREDEGAAAIRAGQMARDASDLAIAGARAFGEVFASEQLVEAKVMAAKAIAMMFANPLQGAAMLASSGAMFAALGRSGGSSGGPRGAASIPPPRAFGAESGGDGRGGAGGQQTMVVSAITVADGHSLTSAIQHAGRQQQSSGWQQHGGVW